MMKTVSVGILVLASVACDRLPWESQPAPATVVTPAPATPVEVPPEPVEEKPPAPLVLSPAAAPATDRRDKVVRRSLDPGDCPDGTHVQGRVPPHGVEQFCARRDGTRFGPARVWPADALPSSGGYMPGKNFRPIRAAAYHDGELHGPILTWWSSGVRRSLERFNVGVPMGIWATWDEEGHMVSQRNYFGRDAPPPPEIVAQTGQPREAWAYGATHLHTEFFADGQTSLQRIQVDDEHALLAGKRTWYKNGQLKCQVDQIADRTSGHVLSTCWYEDGTKRDEGGQRAGKRHGDWTEWAKNGTVKVQGSYFEGKKTGTWERVVRGKKKVQTYAVPIAQKLDSLPKMWTQVFQAGKTVVLRPDCDGVSRSITITADHLIIGKNESHSIETVTRDEDTYSLGLAGKQSIRVLYQGEGTAAIWKEPSKKLAVAAGIYVPTSMVPKLRVEPAECPKK